jgi:acetolactate synthase I/III small subunit
MNVPNGPQEDVHTLSIFVANRPGVLARIAQVFARRGYNIDSLVVSPSTDGRYSRMTIAAKGSTEGLDQILKQVGKLVDVMHCTDHAFDDAVVQELALIKVRVGLEARTEALQVCEHFGAETVDLTETSMIVRVTGATSKLDACVGMLKKFKIIELVRTGKVVMARGEHET